MTSPPPQVFPKTRIRQAEPKDTDAITNLFLTCIATDSMFRNRYRYREQYPDDHLRYGRLFIELMISGSYPDFLTLVLEVEEHSTWNIAALSIWDISYENKRIFAARGEPYIAPTPNSAMEAAGSLTRKDKDPIYESVFIQHISSAQKSFAELFNGNNMYLSLLGTHPAYRRRGYATQLLRWGIGRSERDCTPICLSASPMGELTYLACGFKELGRLDVVVEGEYDREVLVMMVYRPRGLIGDGDENL